MRRQLALLPALALAGCISAPQAPPAETAHTLAFAPPGQASTPAAQPPVLAVPETSAAPGYDSPAMLYRPAPHVLRRYARHRWVDSPARLLTAALREGLASGGALVAAPGSGVRPDYRLASELLRLEQDFTSTPSRVVLHVRLQLVALRAHRVVASRTVYLERAAPSDDPAGGVAAANALLAELLAAAQALWETALRAQPPPAHSAR